jgi:hypothetical protein
MAISTNDIKIKYVIDDSELRKAATSFDKLTQEEQDAIAGMKKLNTELGNTGKKAADTGDKLSNAFDKGKEGVGGLSKSLNGLGPAIVGAFSVTAVLGFAKAVFDTTANFEKMASVLKNQLGSGSQASIVLEGIKEFAKTTPFSVQELTDSFIKLNGAGVRPSIEQMRKLGDVASSQGKSFIQLSEAILDARNFEFERLKELNINTRTVGDNLIFTFNNVQTTVKKNKEAVTEYIYSLGEFNGVAGASAAVSETLGGKVNNLGDAWDNFLNSIGTLLKPTLTAALDVTADFMDKINSLFKLGTTGAQDIEQAELNSFKSFQEKTKTMTDQMLEDRLKKNIADLKFFEKEAAELNKRIEKEGASDIPFILERTRAEKERLKPILEQLAVYKGENAAINEQIKLRNDNTAKTVKVYAEFNAEQKKAADEKAKADKKEYESRLKILELEKQQQVLMAQLRGEKLGEFGAERVYAEGVFNLKNEYSQKNIGLTEQEIKVSELQKDKAIKNLDDATEAMKLKNKDGLDYLRTETDKNYKKGQDALDKDMKQRMDKTQAMHELELERLKKHEENKQAAIQKSFELATTITDGAFGLYQANLNNEMTLLNKRYEEEIRLADGNKQRLTEIEQEKAAKEKEIKTKQFQAEQAAAVARVVFETASQVAKWASNPVTAPLAALTLAVQAAQIGFILAQPVPEFAEGTKGKAFKGGKAMVGERGVEKVVTESGKVYFTPPTATLVDLPKGSHVIPNHALSKQEIYWGSMQSGKQAGSGSPVVGEIRELGSILKGLPITQLNMDERGFEKFIRTPRRTTKILNNRFRTEN